MTDRRYFGLTGRDWIEAVAAGFSILAARYVESKYAPIEPERDELGAAAELLEVGRDADIQQIRAAFRSKMKLRENADSHPDRGGEGDIALRLINAKNVLLAHARSFEETTS
jgi:hypothetical protein